jgi:hypothetical protein
MRPRRGRRAPERARRDGAGVIAQHREVARLVVGLRRRRHLRVDVVEALGEIGRDRPRRELAPHQHGEELHRARLRRRVAELGRAVLGDELRQRLARVPGVLLPDVVEALELLGRAACRGVELVLDERVGRPGGVGHL